MDPAFFLLSINNHLLRRAINAFKYADLIKLKFRNAGFALLGLFLTICSAQAHAAPPYHYTTCSYYGYFPYTEGSYQRAIECADRWVEDGWKICPSCQISFSYSLKGHPWPYNGGHIYVYRCDGGTFHDEQSGECVPEVFTLVVPDETSPPQQCAGNPVDTSSGVKLQREQDIFPLGRGQLELTRYYSAANADQSWRFSYQQSLHVIDPMRMRSPNPAFRKGAKEASQTYGSREDACNLGWEEIQSRLNATWAQGATAVSRGDVCEISKDGRVVRNLSVILGQYPAPGPALVRLIRASGSVLSYQKSGASWRALGSDAGNLEQVTDGAVAWRYAKDDITEAYSSDGKLLSITHASGEHQTLIYDSTTGLLSHVMDSAGRTLQFGYEQTRISSVTVGDQRHGYSYNQAGLLVEVLRPDNTRRIYHYEDPRFPTYLTGITDERGVRYATWTYDALGRAISSEHAGGADRTQLAFNSDGSTTVTNPLGKKTTYHYADIAGARRVTSVEGHATPSCDGANQNYTYTPEGWIASKTDWNGNTTAYSYNSKGQEISRTEASGTPQARTTTTEWHPTFQLKARVVEPGQETLYTYDTQGRLTGTTISPVAAQ